MFGQSEATGFAHGLGSHARGASSHTAPMLRMRLLSLIHLASLDIRLIGSSSRRFCEPWR